VRNFFPTIIPMTTHHSKDQTSSTYQSPEGRQENPSTAPESIKFYDKFLCERRLKNRIGDVWSKMAYGFEMVGS
jgi:hypothetical protein